MRRIAIVLCSICLIGAGLPAQQPSQVFRGTVDLVTLDVTVVDRDGKPVKGLTPDDFVVTLNGERREVRVLDYLEFGGLSDLTSEPSAQVSNQKSPATQRRGGRVILLVVDDLSAKPAQMVALRTAAQHMLASLDLGDLVGLATTSGLGPVINPTRERSAVRSALESREIVGRYDETTAPFYISVPEAIEIYQVGGQVFAHEAIDIANNTTTFAKVVNRECRLFLAPGEPADDTWRSPRAPPASRRTCISARGRTGRRIRQTRSFAEDPFSGTSRVGASGPILAVSRGWNNPRLDLEGGS